jgi:hypothetical protein
MSLDFTRDHDEPFGFAHDASNAFDHGPSIRIISIIKPWRFDAAAFGGFAHRHPEQAKTSLLFTNREVFARRRMVAGRGFEPLTFRL